MRDTITWATRYALSLFAGRFEAERQPKGAFLWPPHRLRGTQERLHRGVRPNVPPSIRSAARRLRRGAFA